MLNSNKINEMFLCILSISNHNTQNLSLYINILEKYFIILAWI